MSIAEFPRASTPVLRVPTYCCTASPEAVDRGGVPVEQPRGRGGVEVGGDLVGAEEGLAQAHETLVGVKTHEAEVRELAELDGLQGGDAHGPGVLLAARRGASP